MIGLSKWSEKAQAGNRLRLKARKKSSKKSSKGKSLLFKKELTSGSEESAAVHFVQSDLASFSDGTSKSDNDPAVVSTVETLTVAGCDGPVIIQEKEVRSIGGIMPR